MADVKLADCRVVCRRCGGLGSIESSHQEDARFSFQDQCPVCSSFGVVPMSEADMDSLIRERGVTDEMVERGRFPILDTTAMFASKMLGITHEEAMEREDIQRMASIVARAVLEAALMTKGG